VYTTTELTSGSHDRYDNMCRLGRLAEAPPPATPPQTGQAVRRLNEKRHRPINDQFALTTPMRLNCRQQLSRVKV